VDMVQQAISILTLERRWYNDD